MSAPSAAPVILITGASRGIGRAITEHLLHATTSASPSPPQPRLFLVSRTSPALESIKSSAAPGRVEYLAGDLADAATAARAVRAAVESFGRLDAVVVNHGVLAPVERLENADVAQWERAWRINFLGVVALIKEAIPHLRATNGRAIFVSSGAAATPYLGWGAYGSSKAALNHLSATLAAEEPDITSIAIRPGVIDTQMQTDIRNLHGAAMGASHDRFVQLKASGSLLRPEQPGSVIARLALGAERALSGNYLNWNAEELEKFQD